MIENNRQNAEDVGATFRAALQRMDKSRPILILGHFDADGLSALAILARSMQRNGLDVITRIVGKAENPWSPDLRSELEHLQPGGLIVTDLGVRAGSILPGVPTLLLDHHVPAGTPDEAAVISGNGWVPEPTSSLLGYWCATGLGPAEDLLWLAAIGLIGDMADPAFAELVDAQARFGKTALRDAVSLINAPRRTAAADATPALALLMRCNGAKELVKGDHPEIAVLRAAKAEVSAALEAARRAPPKVRGDVALVRFSSGCQVHPLVAQSWRGRLKDKIVLAVNTGYRPGWIHFAARTATNTDLIAFLAQHRPPGAGPEYGSGHVKATGGALRPADWNDFVARIGFREEKVEE